jgi:hypothetical protein
MDFAKYVIIKRAEIRILRLLSIGQIVIYRWDERKT